MRLYFIVVLLYLVSFAQARPDLKLQRLVVVDDACNEEDAVHTEKQNFKQLSLTCERGCSADHACTTECLHRLGMSQTCAMCFAQEAQCISAHCSSECTLESSLQCNRCSREHCNVARECAKSWSYLQQH